MENSEFSKYMKRSLVYGYLSVFLGGYYVPSEKRLNSLSLKSEGQRKNNPIKLEHHSGSITFPCRLHTYV